MSVLVHKGLPFSCQQVITDSKEQFIILHAVLYGSPLILVTGYVSSPVTAAVFTDLSVHLSSLPSCPMIIMGDFNSVLQPELDRLKPSSYESKLFRNWCATYGYVDLW